MKVTLNYYLKNGDNQEEWDDLSAEFELTNKTAIKKAKTLTETQNAENTEVFLKSILDSEEESGSKGVLYDKAFEIFVWQGWDKMGWHDVMVYIQSIEIDSNLIEIDEEGFDEYGIQMERCVQSMYFTNI
jgi:hypothetical protein